MVQMKTSESRYSKCLYFSANALARKVEKLAIESWKAVELAPSHGYMLMMILNEPGVQPTSLAEELQLTPSTISRLLEKLEQKKLVVRTTEGKITNVYPTPKAKEMTNLLKQCVQQFNQAYLNLITKEEGNSMVQSMNKISDRL